MKDHMKTVDTNNEVENGERKNSGYVCVIADPPWCDPAFGAARIYDVMTTEQICAMGPSLEPLLAPDCLLWLWVANKNIADGMAVLDAWGFRHGSTLTWAKVGRLGMGSPLRNTTEHVLLGIKGKPELQFRSQGTWFVAPARDHSWKPNELHAIAERVSPIGAKLELFARRPYAGWDVWGNEVESDVPLGPFPTVQKRSSRRAK